MTNFIEINPLKIISINDPLYFQLHDQIAEPLCGELRNQLNFQLADLLWYKIRSLLNAENIQNFS